MKRYLLASVAAIVLVGISALLYGYEYGITPNHIQVLPFIEKIKDPLLFPNDYFVNTLGRFPSAYPYAMASLSKWVDLRSLHLILYLIFKFLLLISVYALALFLFKSDRTAVIAMLLFALSPLVNAYGLLGHDPLMKTSFYQTSAAAPLAVIAILMFLKKRYAAASLILALIYYINTLIGNFLFVIFLFGAAHLYLRAKDKQNIGKIRNSFILFILLMLPAAMWIARLDASGGARASSNFALYLKFWYAGHYFPSTFSVYKWRYFAVVCVFFAIFFRRRFGYCRENETVKYFLWAIVAMWLSAAAFAELLPLRNLILLQFLRSDVFFILFGLIFAADYISGILHSGALRDIAIAGLAMLALTEFLILSNTELILVILLLKEFEKPIETFLRKATKEPEKLFEILWNAVLVFLIICFASDLFTSRGSPRMGCVLIFLLILAPSGSRSIPPRFRGLAAVSALLVVFLSCSHIFEYRIASGNFSNTFDKRSADWEDVQLWARDNTPVNAVFMVPLDMNGFRVYSKRSVFVDWVDGSAMHWAPGFERAWVERLARVGIGEELIKMNTDKLCGLGDPDRKPIHRFLYMKMNEDDFRRLKKDYGIDYIVEDRMRSLKFKAVYENATFRVYKVG